MQAWQPAADGGYLSNPPLSRQLRHVAQPMMKFLQFVRPENGIGKNVGDTLDFDKISNILVAASQTGLAETLPIPESKFQVSRGNLTMREYGNSVPYTGKLATLAQFDPSNIAQRVLTDDQAKTLDAVIASFFKAGQVIATPRTGGAGGLSITNGLAAPSATADKNLDLDDAKSIIDHMKSSLLIEPFDGENYICIGSVKALRGIKNSADFKLAAQYGDPERLFTGEVGKIEGCRFIETNHALALENSIAATGLGEAVFFGADPVVEGIAIAPEIRAKIPTDYGRSRGVAWYALMGHATPWRYIADNQARIVWVTSVGNVLGPPAGY